MYDDRKSRSIFVLVVFLTVFLITYSQLNFAPPPVIAPHDISYTEHPFVADDPPHKHKPKPSALHPQLTDLEKDPLRIYIPPETSNTDPLEDVWATEYHKQALSSAPPPADPEAYHKGPSLTTCPPCEPNYKNTPFDISQCPSIQYLSDKLKGPVECPFDISLCPSIDYSGKAQLPEETPAASKKPLISYVYTDSPSARKNLAFFINHGLHDAADFVFILNGATDVDETIIPAAWKNINIIKREDECFTLGAHSEILSKDDVGGKKALKDRYDRFILMDSSLRGPFIPRWSKECWTQAYLGRLGMTVKLVGAALSCTANSTPHVQTSILATDSLGLSALLGPDGINECFNNAASFKEGEIRATQNTRRKMYEVDVMVDAFASEKDYRYVKCADDQESFLGIGVEGAGAVNPYERLFVKMDGEAREGNDVVEMLSKGVGANGYSSYQACKKYGK